MGLRFRKRITIAPGLRLNLSMSGVSFSVGPRGLSTTVGKRGVYVNAGLPGTGFYTRERVIGRQKTATAHNNTNSTFAVTIKVEKDGTITCTDSSGSPLAEHLASRVKKEHRDVILQMLQQICDQTNEMIEAVAQVHLRTPSPHKRPIYSKLSFEISPPAAPEFVRPGFLASLFRSKREKIAQRNADAQYTYDHSMAEWQRLRSEHGENEFARKKLIEHDIYVDLSAMEYYLESVLSKINWPRETIASFEIADAGTKVMMDVDLPEIEDMPTKSAMVPQRGLKLTVKELSPTKVRRLYYDHVHGIIFRLIGETFAALPKTQTIVISGYSQRPDKGTGQIQDQYLLSVRVSRVEWSAIDFNNLDVIDVSEALARFDLRRGDTKSAALKAIAAFST